MNKKFLIIQTAFIGDVVLATALVENLHAQFPEARIDFLLRKGNETLLLHHPYIHELLIWDKKKDKLPNLFKTLKSIRRNRYDAVINVQRYAATGLLTVFSGAKERIGFDKNPFSFLFSRKALHEFSGSPIRRSQGSPDISHGPVDHLHEIDRNHLLIERLVTSGPLRPALYPSVDDFQSVQKYQGQSYITMSPSSVWFTKQYPKEKWISMIKQIDADQIIYLLGGPDDAGHCEEIRKTSKHPGVINLAGRLNFLQSAALMKSARMNFVNDSAPMHFASAVNAPVTAIFCSTIPAFGYGPLSDKRFIVQIEEPLYCRPCGLHGHRACPEGHFRCALEIRDQQLLEKVKS